MPQVLLTDAFIRSIKPDPTKRIEYRDAKVRGLELRIAAHHERGRSPRIWTVLSDWRASLRHGAIVMTWAESAANGGLGLATLGEPAKDIVAHEAMLLVRRPLSPNNG